MKKFRVVQVITHRDSFHIETFYRVEWSYLGLFWNPVLEQSLGRNNMGVFNYVSKCDAITKAKQLSAQEGFVAPKKPITTQKVVYPTEE